MCAVSPCMPRFAVCAAAAPVHIHWANHDAVIKAPTQYHGLICLEGPGPGSLWGRPIIVGRVVMLARNRPWVALRLTRGGRATYGECASVSSRTSPTMICKLSTRCQPHFDPALEPDQEKLEEIWFQTILGSPTSAHFSRSKPFRPGNGILRNPDFSCELHDLLLRPSCFDQGPVRFDCG